MLKIPPARFEVLVSRALDRLPEEFHAHMENVSVMIADEPDRETLAAMGDLDDRLNVFAHEAPVAGEHLADVHHHVQLARAVEVLKSWTYFEQLRAKPAPAQASLPSETR